MGLLYDLYELGGIFIRGLKAVAGTVAGKRPYYKEKEEEPVIFDPVDPDYLDYIHSSEFETTPYANTWDPSDRVRGWDEEQGKKSKSEECMDPEDRILRWDREKQQEEFDASREDIESLQSQEHEPYEEIQQESALPNPQDGETLEGNENLFSQDEFSVEGPAQDVFFEDAHFTDTNDSADSASSVDADPDFDDE